MAMAYISLYTPSKLSLILLRTSLAMTKIVQSIDSPMAAASLPLVDYMPSELLKISLSPK